MRCRRPPTTLRPRALTVTVTGTVTGTGTGTGTGISTGAGAGEDGRSVCVTRISVSVPTHGVKSRSTLGVLVEPSGESFVGRLSRCAVRPRRGWGYTSCGYPPASFSDPPSDHTSDHTPTEPPPCARHGDDGEPRLWDVVVDKSEALVTHHIVSFITVVVRHQVLVRVAVVPVKI